MHKRLTVNPTLLSLEEIIFINRRAKSFAMLKERKKEASRAGTGASEKRRSTDIFINEKLQSENDGDDVNKSTISFII